MTQDAHGAERRGGGHGHAVVIGSSLAGLAAARALAGVMDHVTVIDRDWIPQGPGRRRGVPQARHTHTLTHAAQQGLEQLFPGISADLEAAGAVRVRTGEDLLVLGPGGWLPRTETGLPHLSAGRDLIDAVLRDRLRAETAVTFLPEHEAVGLEGGPQDTVTGVWIRPARRTTPRVQPEQRLISADFVVDASGRDSHAPRWLADLGYTPPRETVTEAPATVATAVFAPPVGHVADFTALLLLPAPGHPAQGMLQPLEGGRWSVTVTTPQDQPAPADHAALLRAAAALRHPLLADLIETATPLGPVYRAGATPGRWRHYEKLRRFPDQFLVIGDAYATLDPLHGQGMTHAINGALVLDQLLTAHGTAIGLGYRLRRALAHHLAPAWRHAARAPRAAHDDPATGIRARLAARLAAAATTDPHAAAHLLQHLHTPARPTAGLRPRLWRAALRGAPGPAPAAPPSTTHGPHPRRRAGAPPPPATRALTTAAARTAHHPPPQRAPR